MDFEESVATGVPSASVVFETLPSGLTLVAEPWGPAPVVAVQVWVAAGSSSDPATASGAAAT